MAYRNLQEAVIDLERTGQLIRIKEEIDPYLEMASIQLRAYREGGPAILFENVKGTKYKALANLYGTLERCNYLFRETLPKVQDLMALRESPMEAFKKPISGLKSGVAALSALPLKLHVKSADYFEQISISDLPQIQHWPLDGGAFITLPQVFTENPERPGVMHGNMGMYRVQLAGNDYLKDQQIGLHYQIHRGIGIHQQIAAKQQQPLKVSIFIGGPPAHSVAAVMPLPEGVSELTFAGLLAGRRFRYFYEDGYVISRDADFVITGEIAEGALKPEGPFGDHLGYYSLTHPFPYLKVHKVLAKKDAIWPFTVVGRPPQEDTSFGALIHEMTAGAIRQEIPGVKAVNAVDEAGVHPLLLAIGSERYTPYQTITEPAELLTQANRILGTGQLSLAKYLFITDDPTDSLSVQDIPAFFKRVLERIQLDRDLHFQTCTTIDTLDYSGTALNKGSKVVIAAAGPAVRTLSSVIPDALKDALQDELLLQDYPVALVMPGVLAVEVPAIKDPSQGDHELAQIKKLLFNHKELLTGLPLIVLTENASFLADSLANFLWVSFTRSNPGEDIHGLDQEEQIVHKHWGCKTSLIIDARIKSRHAPALVLNPDIEAKVDQLLQGYRPYFPMTLA